jgi:hypothetical protein
MKLKALLTTLVLGSSSVAMAHPTGAIVRDHRTPAEDCGHVHTLPAPAPAPMPAPRPIYQPVQQPAPIYQPMPGYHRPYHRSWIPLGGINYKVDGEMSFRGRGGEQFSKLKLQSDAGKALIYRVLIQFTNGRTQVVELNQYLRASNPTITIDLDGRARAIAKVTVIGRNAPSSAYRVLAI